MTDSKDLKENYIDINKIAELKGLKSNRSLRIEINKPDSKYISRKIKTKGGYTYEILFTSLEPEIQEKLLDEEIKSKSLVPINNIYNIEEPKLEFKTEKLKVEALAKIDLIKAFEEFLTRFDRQKEAKENFIALYNSGEYFKYIYKILGKISYSSLYRWRTTYNQYQTVESLIPKYKCSKIDEYNTSLTPEMIEQFEKFLFHPNKFKVEKAINLTKFCLERKGITDLPANIAFRRYADKFKVLHYDKWVLFREGEKAFNDKVEPYIERDISKIDVGDVLVADGHELNFQVINPFTGNPTRATLVGFFDWKSSTLIGYEIMMTENTQCIASALRNSIINLGRIPKIVYQDNGRAFRAKYFQNSNFDEAGFNGVYANLGITSVFAKVRNAKAKVIERFFLEFQEELEKMMPSYIGTSIEDKPARLMRGENLHKAHYLKTTGGRIPTVQEAIKCIDYWLNYHNSKPCPHDKTKSIKEVLNTVQKEFIDKNKLNYLMMKTEVKVIHRNGIRFLNQNYNNNALFGLREFLNGTFITDIQKAVQFYFLITRSFGGKGDTFGTVKKSNGGACKSQKNVLDKIDAIHERLDKVMVENRDFEKLIKQYDFEGAFFYCDPPYTYGTGYEVTTTEDFDHERLRDSEDTKPTEPKVRRRM